jgi:molecular chaperone DnaK
MSDPAPILGIDLGTTNSAVGVVDAGFPILLADREGRRILPSAVWIGADGAVETGQSALRRRAADPGRVVTSVKRLMGRRPGEETLGFPLPVETGADGIPRVLGKTAVEISAEILRELKRTAEWRMGRPLTRAVITVPAYFNDAQRAATKLAGEAAGFEVLRILNEPTAAALAYGLDKLAERSRVAVYDLGGGTFDVTILEMQEGVFEVLSTDGDTRLGGDDLDALLVAHIEQATGVKAADPLTRIRFLAEAERVKRELSDSESAVFRLPFVEGGRSVEQTVTRTQLAGIAMPWIRRTLRHCAKALADAATAPEQLDAVVLVGGSTRMPAVREAVAAHFGREPDVSQHPDEAIALGAAIQAGVLGGTMRRMVLLDVTPLSLGIETVGGLMNVLIPRNTTIPCKAGEMFTNAADDQRAMSVRILQGEREMARDNWELGKFEVAFQPAPRGRARVGVQFRIDENGMLEVLARDTATGEDTVVQLGHTAVDVDDSKVGEMVESAVEHAFADMDERVFTEARLKAEELLPAVESVLAGEGISPDERMEIEAAAAAVRTALDSGVARILKAAVERLDAATEALAARLVEAAFERALGRRIGSPD